MIAAATWPVVVLAVVVFTALCFLAVLWSRREWNSRKIRLGVFLEREYLVDGDEDDVTRIDAKRTDAHERGDT